MIATRRGLAILAALACALLVLLVVDVARRDGPVDRTLVPGFDEASVVRLAWTAHPIGPYLTVEREKGKPWRRTVPTPGAVEQTPVQGLLATLRGARWHRVKERDPRENAAHLAVDHAGGRLELWIGYTTEGEQSWIGIGDRSYLVDAWVARALAPSPLELAIRAPLAGIASVDTYTVDGVRIEGTPRRIAVASAGTPSQLVLDPAFVADLERALAELVIDDTAPKPNAKVDVITEIEMAGTRVVLGGPCESRVYMMATTGDGCVPRAKAEAVAALVTTLKTPAIVAARAPVPVGVEWVTLVDGKKLDLRKRPTIDNADAKTDEVLALMTVLRSPVELVDVVSLPATKPIGALVIGTVRDEIALSLHPDNLVARAGESVALRLAPEAFAVLSRGASAYQDRTPWREEPTTIDEIVIDNVTYKRGVVLGEWTRTPAGATDEASIEALVRALAEPRVLGVARTTVANGRHVRLVVRPPTGGEKTHTLVLGAVIATGCPASIDSATLLLPVEICRLVPR